MNEKKITAKKNKRDSIKFDVKLLKQKYFSTEEIIEKCIIISSSKYFFKSTSNFFNSI